MVLFNHSSFFKFYIGYIYTPLPSQISVALQVVVTRTAVSVQVRIVQVAVSELTTVPGSYTAPEKQGKNVLNSYGFSTHYIL